MDCAGEPRICSGIPATCPHCLTHALKHAKNDAADSYARGAEAMRSACIARFNELANHWKALADSYDPRGQWDDREIARIERASYLSAIDVVMNVTVENDPPLAGSDVGVY